MAEEKIELTLEIKARGASGVTTEVKKLEGSFNDVRQELIRLSDAGAGFGYKTRKQITALSSALVGLQLEAQAAGRTLSAVEAKGIGTKKARISSVNSNTGSELSAARQLRKDQENEGRQRIAFMKQQAAEEAAIERKKYQEQIALGNLFIREKKQQEAQQRQQQQDFSKKLDFGRATLGFIGVNIAKSLGDVLDPVKLKGQLAPKVKEISSAIGGLFGSTLGEIFGNVGNAVGILVESVFDTVFAVLRTGLKFISGFGQALAIALIAPFSIFQVAIGIVGGVIQGIINAFSELLRSVIDIVTNLMGAITSLISAGLKIVGAVFEGITNFITGLWNAFWDGLKSVAEFSINTIEKVVSVVLDQLGKGFADFVEAEKLATKSFDNIGDAAKNFGGFASGVKAIDQLSDSLRTQYGITVEQAESGIYDTLSGKFKDLADATLVSDAAAKLHIATQASFADSNKILNTSLIAFGKSAEDAEKISGELYNTARLGRTDLTHLAESFGPAAVAASQAGVSFEEFNAAVAVATLSGLTASQAQIGLQRVLSAINDPTAKNAKTFKEYGIAIRNADGSTRNFRDIIKDLADQNPEKLRALFGPIQAVRFFRALKDNVPLLDEFIKTIGSDNTTFGQAIDNATKSFFFMLDVVSQIGIVIRKNLAGGFAEVFRKPLEAIIPKLQELQDALDGPKVASFFKAFADFGGPIIQTVLNPIYGLIDGIINFITKTDFDSFFKSEEAKRIQTAIQTIYNFVVDLGAEILRSLIPNMTDFGSAVKSVYEKYVKPMVDYLNQPEAIQNMIDGVKDFGQKLLDIKDTVIAHLFDPAKMRADLQAIFTFLADSIKAIGKFLLDELILAFKIGADFFVSVLGARLKEVGRSFAQQVLGTLGGFFGNQALAADKRNEELERKRDQEEGGIATPEQYSQMIANSGIATISTELAKAFGSGREALNPNNIDDDVQRNVAVNSLSKFLKENINKAGVAGSFNEIITPILDQELGNFGVGSGSANVLLKSLAKDPDSFKDGKRTETDDHFLDLLTHILSDNSVLNLVKNGGNEKLADELKDIGAGIRISATEIRSLGGFNRGVADFGPSTDRNVQTLQDNLGGASERLLNGIPKTLDPVPVIQVNPDKSLQPPSDPTPILREQLNTLKAINDNIQQRHAPARVISGAPATFRDSPTINGP